MPHFYALSCVFSCFIGGLAKYPPWGLPFNIGVWYGTSQPSQGHTFLYWLYLKQAHPVLGYLFPWYMYACISVHHIYCVEISVVGLRQFLQN
jgi:hypothetical protein